MDFFVDTSAIVKLYHLETGTSDVVKEIEKATGIFVSQITAVEYHSAFYKKLRIKEISQSELNKALDLFDNDLKSFQIIPINSDLINLAKKLLTKYGKKGLRTWDSIQLASALIQKDNYQYALCADGKLKSFLSAEKIRVK